MKTLRSAVQICPLFLCLLLVSTGLASASTVTLSGNILFSSLDGSAQDGDGLANGVFTVNGDLVIAGTINCNDDPPLSSNASACPIRIAVTGDLTMAAGSGIFAENRRNGGHGGDIRLDVGGDLSLQGPGGGLSGAVVSSSRLSDGNSWRAGNITILVEGGVELQASSAVSASTLGGSAGTIAITAEGTIQAAGLIASGPSRTVLPSRWTGLVLGGGANGQIGGSISLRSRTSAEPAIRIDSGGVVASQGEEGGGRLVLLEGCGIEVRGLVASVSKQGGPSLVAIRSGKGILVDGRDLGAVGSRLGRIRADGSLGGAAGYLVDLFAANDIQVLGPDPSSTASYTVSSSPGSQAQRPAGGTITAISLSGSLTAAGKAFEAGRLQDGNKGGTIDLKARNDVSLDGASLAAVGDFTSSSKSRAGGRIFARSYQGAVSWIFGVGDVRPTGTGVSAANRGTITLTACTTVDTTGTQFPVTGAAVPPFPVENEGVCSPSAPVLPAGEPPLPVCSQPQVAQTISFTSTAPVGATVGSPPYNVTATATSGLPVTFTIDPSASTVCSIVGSTVSFTGVGTCVINANQAGDANYAAAPQVQQSFPVGQGSQTITFTSAAPAGATVGGPTYNVTATASSGLPVALTIDTSASTVCSIAGSTVSFIGVGTCVINANQAGDASYAAAPQVQQSFPVGQSTQTISFTSTAPVGATVGSPPYNVTATATSGLPVTFTIDPSANTVCSIAGSTVSFTGVGTCVINANQAGNANYAAAPQVQQSFPVGQGTQTITFTSAAPVGATVGSTPYNVTATATSGLPVTFTIDPSASTVCSIAGSTVSFTGVGTCVINANQAGNANYAAAPQVQQSFPVGQGSQTISFTSSAPVGAAVGGATYNVTAVASPSGLPVTFTIDASASTVCSIAGSTVSFTGAGTCVINANQAGNANYTAAPQVQQSFLVGKGSQTITFTSTAPLGATVGGATYNVTATASPSGLPVTFTIDASASTVCSIAGSTVSFIGAGTCVINANQAGNADYNPAPQVQQSFPVAKGSQTISFTSTAPTNAMVGGATYTVTATATSGLPVTFTIDASASTVCSIAGSTVSFIGTGTCVINANQAGNANYNPAPQVQQSFMVFQAPQITSANTTSFTSGLAGTFTVTTTGFPTGASMNITETGALPSGVTFTTNNNGTATLAGTPAPGTQGVYSITITADNGVPPAAMQTFTLNVINMPPQLVASPKETFDTIGNTAFEFKAEQGLSLGIFLSGNLVANFTDIDGPNPLKASGIGGCADLTTPFGDSPACVTANGGSVVLLDTGEFTFTPKAGDIAVSDSFQYKVTDGLDTVMRTVTISLKNRVWYVQNDSAADGLGRSNDPFDTLVEAQTASVAGDTIYVYEGNGSTTGQNQGIVLKANQRLIGEGVELNVPVAVNGGPNPTMLRAPGNRPDIDNVNAGGHAVFATDAIPKKIAGLNLIGSANAIDITTNVAFAGSGDLTIESNTIDNTVRLGGAEGIDINAGGTGTLTLVVRDNTLTAAATAIDITRTNGTLVIAALSGHMISGNTGGTGIIVNGPATFNSTSIGGVGPVLGGNTVIGAPGNAVNGAGLVLNTVTGALDFADLDVFAGNGAGISVTGTGAYSGAAGTRVMIPPGMGIVESTNGPGVSVSNATIDMRLSTLMVNSSPTTGVSLVNVSDASVAPLPAAFSAGSGSSIANVTGTDFNVDGGNATITYNGSITNTAGRSVSVQNRTGDTVTFTNTTTISDTGAGILVNANAAGAVTDFFGTLTLSTGTNDAFVATSGGTLRVRGTANTIVTTTGVALNVTSTTIGAGSGAPETGLRFRSISAGTGAAGPSSGIVLNNTGALGSLTVTGTGGAGTGGTIQRTTGHGVSLTSTLSPSFTSMMIKDTGGSGVKGTTVTNFTFVNGSIDNSGTALGVDESNLAFNTSAAGTENNLSGTVTITGNTLSNAYYHGVDILNFNGTVNDITLSGNTLTSATSTVSSKGSGIRLQALGSATTVANIVKASLSNNTISRFPSGNGILMNCGNASTTGTGGSCGTPGSAANVITISGNSIAGQASPSQMGSNAIAVALTGGNGASRSQANFDVSDNGTLANPLTNFKGTGVACSVFGMSTATCNVTDNIMVANNIVASRCIAVGVDRTISAGDTPDLTATISGNQISACDGNGIFTGALNSNGTARIKVQNNIVSAPLTGVRPGIRVDSGTPASVGTNTTVCLNISGNTSAGSGGTQGIGLRKEGTASATNALGVNGMAATSSPGVETYINGLNPAGNGTLLISATSGFTNCTLP